MRKHWIFNVDMYFMNKKNNCENHNETRISLGAYLIANVFFSCTFLFFEANWGDVGYWRDWTRQLIQGGYAEFTGNYPPVYIHWLYVVSKIYQAFNMVVEDSLFLKYISVLPAIAGHLLLVFLVHSVILKFNPSAKHYHKVMFLSALNPALLLDGPVWGQVDILPILPVLAAFLLNQSARLRVLTLPTAFFSLLIKFQMIAFAPVMALIFIRNFKVHMIGLALSIPVFGIVYSPFMLSGNFIEAFNNAYIHVLDQYSRTTMGASNIWILLTGNAAPDSVLLFSVAESTWLSGAFRAKNFGIIIFSIVCLLIFIHGISSLFVRSCYNEKENLLVIYLRYAMLCALAFFTFLPAMHERYLIPAVVMSIVYFAAAGGRATIPLMLTFVSAMNLLVTLGVKAHSVWPVISVVCILAFFLAVLDAFLPKVNERLINSARFILSMKYFSSITVFVVLSILFGVLLLQSKIFEPSLEHGQKLLTEMKVVKQQQSYGRLRINQSVNGNVLTVGSRRYASGFGTHANSHIEFELEPGVQALDVAVGVDDEIGLGKLKFLVLGDGKVLWQSPALTGRESIISAHISLDAVKVLVLKVDALGEITNDHANWLNPILTYEAKNHD